MYNYLYSISHCMWKSTLYWTPNELVYKFDDEIMWRHNLDKNIHEYYGSELEF